MTFLALALLFLWSHTWWCLHLKKVRNKWQLLGCPRIRQNWKNKERWLFLSQLRKEQGRGRIVGCGGWSQGTWISCCSWGSGGAGATSSRRVCPASPAASRVVLSLHRCDADPSALANYVVALVKKDKPEKELKAFCADQLDVFLQKGTVLPTAWSLLGGSFHWGEGKFWCSLGKLLCIFLVIWCYTDD